jgi:hypothetical protein
VAVSNSRFAAAERKLAAVRKSAARYRDQAKSAGSVSLELLGAGAAGAVSGYALDIEVMADDSVGISLELPVIQMAAGAGLLYYGMRSKSGSLVALGKGMLVGSTALATRDTMDYYRVLAIETGPAGDDGTDAASDDGGN